jgi:hypothetical protein
LQPPDHRAQQTLVTLFILNNHAYQQVDDRIIQAFGYLAAGHDVGSLSGRVSL